MKRITIVISALAFGLFAGLGVKSITTNNNKIQIKDIQLKSTTSDLKTLQLKYDNLNIQLDKTDKNNTQEIKKLEDEKSQLQNQLQDAQKQIQAKAEEKRRLASIQLSQPVYAESMPQTGSGCGWLAGRLAANGVGQADIPAAINIAFNESGCSPSAVNPGGACNVFQELPCGKWGGRSNIDAHIQGASAYAKNRYGGWQGAWSTWQRQRWW